MHYKCYLFTCISRKFHHSTRTFAENYWNLSKIFYNIVLKFYFIFAPWFWEHQNVGRYRDIVTTYLGALFIIVVYSNSLINWNMYILFLNLDGENNKNNKIINCAPENFERKPENPRIWRIFCFKELWT